LIRDYRPEPRDEIDEFSETFFPEEYYECPSPLILLRTGWRMLRADWRFQGMSRAGSRVQCAEAADEGVVDALLADTICDASGLESAANVILCGSGYLH